MSLQHLRELEDEMHKCFRCNLCKMVPLPVVRHPDFFDGCPANREFVFHSHSGSGKQIMALALIQGRIEADSKLSEITYACTACGSCDVACKFNMDAERQQVNMALREHMVDEGLELPAHKQSVEKLKAHDHPMGVHVRAPGAWAEGLGLKTLPGEPAEVLLFAGCMQRNDPGSEETCQKLARLLLHAGVDVGILGDEETSCGLTAYWTGYRDVFTKTAEKTAKAFNKLNVKTVVTVSGSCLGTFRSKYPEYASALTAKVLHASEFLWELIQERRLALPRAVRRRVTYHDPCYLGRQSEPPVDWRGEMRMARGCMTYSVPSRPVNRGCKGVYDAPRNVLNAVPGLELIEMHRIREYSFCCGGGGGVPDAFPEMARSAALHRIEEAVDVEAECLVTACHECRMNFSRAQSVEDSPTMPVVDMIDLVYEAANL